MFALYSLRWLADFVKAGGVTLRKGCRIGDDFCLNASFTLQSVRFKFYCHNDISSAAVDGVAEIDPTV